MVRLLNKMHRPSVLRWVASALLAICCADVAAYEIVKGPAPTVDSQLHWSAYRRFSSSEGLPGATVNALAQDKDGFVYAGTDNGLAQFDGHAWHKVVLPQNNETSVVLKLLALDDNSIWIGTDNAGLYRYAQGAITAVALPVGASETDIEALTTAAENAAYVGTSRSIYQCTADRCTEIVAARSLQVAELLVGVNDDRRCLWVGTNEDGLYRIEGLESATPVLANWHLSDKELGSRSVRALAQWGGNDRQDLWVGTGFGLARISHQKIVSYGAYENERLNGVSSLLPGRNAEGNDVLHVGMFISGIAEVNLDGTWTIRNRANGLPEDYVTALYQTDMDLRTPVLWVGTQNAGIARRDAGVWSSFDERSGLPDHIIHGMGELDFPDGVRTQWIGTSDGAVRWHGQRWEAWLPPAFQHAVVNTMVRADANVWVGTDFGLINASNGAAFQAGLSQSGLPGAIIESLYYEEAEDRPGTLWIGTHYGTRQSTRQNAQEN